MRAVSPARRAGRHFLVRCPPAAGSPERPGAAAATPWRRRARSRIRPVHASRPLALESRPRRHATRRGFGLPRSGFCLDDRNLPGSAVRSCLPLQFTRIHALLLRVASVRLQLLLLRDRPQQPLPDTDRLRRRAPTNGINLCTSAPGALYVVFVSHAQFPSTSRCRSALVNVLTG